MVHPRDEHGFNLVELMVVLVIIAELLAIGIPTLTGYRTRAYDIDAQSDLRTVVLAENLLHLEDAAFTANTATLSDAEPTVQFNVSGDPEGTVRVETGAVDVEVCIFSLSRSGEWWAIYHTSNAGTRDGQSAPATCQASLASGWSTDAW